MKSNKYEPRACEICGRMYKPGKIDQRTCASKECIHEMRKQNALRWKREHYAAVQENRKKREAKKDTIVAIGYAERQMAASLARAGKVKTEL